MTNEPEKPVVKRASWLTTKPGSILDIKDSQGNQISPITKPVTEEEIEAIKRRTTTRMASWENRHVRAQMGDDERYAAQLQGRKDVHAANLQVFKDSLAQEQLDTESDEFHAARQARAKEQVRAHSLILGGAHVLLGEFDEAVRAVESIEGPEADYIRKQSADFQAALAKPDDEDCEHPAPMHSYPEPNGTISKYQGVKHHMVGKVVVNGEVLQVMSCPQGCLNIRKENDGSDDHKMRQKAQHQSRIIHSNLLKIGQSAGQKNGLEGWQAQGLVTSSHIFLEDMDRKLPD